MKQTQETPFNVVFEGRYVSGHDPVAAQAAFAERFGDLVAGQVFNQDRTVLKRNLTQEAAQRMQHVLADVGVVVLLAPATEATPARQRKGSGAVSMVERAAERSRARRLAETATAATPKDVAAARLQATPDNPGAAPVSEEAPAAPAPALDRARSRRLIWVVLMSTLTVAVSLLALQFSGW